MIPLWKALAPGDRPFVTSEGDRAFVAVGLSKRSGPRSWTRASSLYVATPELLGHLGIDPETVDRRADFLADPTVPTEDLVILGIGTRQQTAITKVQRIESLEVLGAGGPTPAACHPRSSPSTVFAATAGRRWRRAGSLSRVGL